MLRIFYWEQRKLDDIVSFYSGLTYSPKNIISEDGVFVIRSSNIQNNRIVEADNVYVDVRVVNSKYVSIDDIIVVVRNGSKYLIGKHAIVKKDLPHTVIGAFMTGIKSDTPNFINALLDTEQFKNEIHKNLGATINQITTGNLKNMKFNFAQTKERVKIGEFTRRLEDILELHQRSANTLKKLRQSLIKAIIPVKIHITPRIKFYGFNQGPQFYFLKNILTERRDLTPESSEYPLMSFIQGKGVIPKNDRYDRSFLVKENNKKYKKTILGDFIYSSNNLETGSIGLNNTGNAVISPVYSIFYSNNIVESKYIGFMSNNKSFINEMIRYRQGVVYGQWRIHEKDFLNIKVLIPAITEQYKAVYLFENLDLQILLKQKKIKKLLTLKNIYLNKMFI